MSRCPDPALQGAGLLASSSCRIVVRDGGQCLRCGPRAPVYPDALRAETMEALPGTSTPAEVHSHG